MARIIPVIDVIAGRVVRAVGGRRDEYRPIQSRLTQSTDQVEVARTLIELTQAKEIYIADLDSILDPSVDTGLSARICDALPNVGVLSDVGVRTDADLMKLDPNRPGRPAWEDRRRLVPVIGTETVSDARGWAA